MNIEQLVEYLHNQPDLRSSPSGKEVVLRVTGRDYAIRGVYATASSLIIEGGEEVTPQDTPPRRQGGAPGGPEGEGVEPAPPRNTQGEREERRR